jgi:hypothetical protein
VSDRHRGWALGTAAGLVVAYAGLCKALLFRDLEYVGMDFFSFLEMSWSWFYAGLWLHDNVYGHHYALHSFDILPLFSPFTIPFGAYGLIVGLALLNALAAWRVATLRGLDTAGRLTVLAGLFSPVAFYAFDNPSWGFHPELCYPPLGVLFAAELLAGRRGRAALAALLLVLVKEDGAVVAWGILVAHFASRLWALRHGPTEERRLVLAAALRSLLVVGLVFAANMAILALASHALAEVQATSSRRIADSVRVLVRTVLGGGGQTRRLVLADGLLFYAEAAGLLLLPLASRFPRGAVLLLVSAPPLVVVLLVSAAGYLFSLLVWPARVATFLGLVLACLVIASATGFEASAPPQRRARITGVLVLVGLSWGLQLSVLRPLSYSPWSRLDAPALLAGRVYRIARLPVDQVRLLRCLGKHLPGGLPVSAPEGVHPFFHRQSIVVEPFASRVWQRPRLRVVPESVAATSHPETPCAGPGGGGLAVQAECALLPLVAACSPSP